jgi:hypothetical protein
MPSPAWPMMVALSAVGLPSELESLRKTVEKARNRRQSDWSIETLDMNLSTDWGQHLIPGNDYTKLSFVKVD